MTNQAGKRNAFTLLELMVVIVIIALLAGVMVTKYSKVRENGWASQCKANLRSLYQAAMNYSNDNGGGLPAAGPYEWSDLAGIFHEQQAWVNWTPNGSPGVWPNNTSQLGHTVQPTWYGAAARTSITNGLLWDYTSRDMGAYICPKFRSLAQSYYPLSDAHYDVVRSYSMNYVFGCNDGNISGSPVNMIGFAQEASRTLLFADMQLKYNYCFESGNPQVCWGTYAGAGWPQPAGDDGVLDSTNKTAGVDSRTQPWESIGYSHPMSGSYYGHAVFLDGHIDAVGLVKTGGSWSNRTHDACTGQF